MTNLYVLWLTLLVHQPMLSHGLESYERQEILELAIV